MRVCARVSRGGLSGWRLLSALWARRRSSADATVDESHFRGNLTSFGLLTMMRHIQLVVDCGEFFFLSFFISFFGRDRWLSFGFSVFGAHGISMLNSPNEDYKRNVSDKVLLSDLLKYPPSPLEELGTTEFASSHFDKRTFTHNTLLQTCPNVQSHLSYLRLIQPLSTRSCRVHRLIQHKW